MNKTLQLVLQISKLIMLCVFSGIIGFGIGFLKPLTRKIATQKIDKIETKLDQI